MRRRNKVGLQPGELVHVGEPRANPISISLLSYNATHFDEVKSYDIIKPLAKERVNWVQIVGVHDPRTMASIGSRYDLHPLVLEDIMTTRQRPKVDEYEQYLFIVLRFFSYDAVSHKIEDEQISLILDKNFILSFQEKPSTVFDTLKDRLRQNKGIVRKQGADFLAYALIDTVVDHYFLLLDSIGSTIESLEDEIEGMTTHKSLAAIHHLRREIVFLRKSILPMREVINHLIRDDSLFISETTKFYLRDVFDHTIQVIESVDTCRDLSRGLLDVQLSHMSYRMNEVIKILTVVSTIFVPLTFITSFYGMNFDHMPELHWRFGYLFAILLMLAVALFMIRFFKKRKWF